MDKDLFVAGGLATHQLEGSARTIQFTGKQLKNSLVGGRVHRWRHYLDLQLAIHRVTNFIP